MRFRTVLRLGSCLDREAIADDLGPSQLRAVRELDAIDRTGVQGIGAGEARRTDCESRRAGWRTSRRRGIAVEHDLPCSRVMPSRAQHVRIELAVDITLPRSLMSRVRRRRRPIEVSPMAVACWSPRHDVVAIPPANIAFPPTAGSVIAPPAYASAPAPSWLT